MDLSMYNPRISSQYKSNSQIVRCLSEHWFTREMFCPACSSDNLQAFRNNYPVADFFCPQCDTEFQLKSQRNRFSKRINDGAYSKMIEAIHHETQPNFFILHYNPLDWKIADLTIIPRFFFTESIIEERKPLSRDAKRAGWIGCNILLSRIPEDGRIPVVKNSVALDQKEIRSSWKKISFLQEKKSSERSWIIDIISCIKQLNKETFTLQELYTHEKHLQENHPNNRNIKPKIRQQLQFLRNKGYLEFLERGVYRLK
ncbi:MAG: DpnI domain-containing protein [Candidatus Altiarchaeota archaeon]|nr:DpnI domain-containing protein [Candidatus Altiarchaeota archaeon]